MVFKYEKVKQYRFFAQYLHFSDFKIIESRKHSGCCGIEFTQCRNLHD
ncbi:MAG TPA: hypothetical protein VKA34_03765 [Balneolales bacterium]|nr:hypothetical protein [Balneolales bacterium]